MSAPGAVASLGRVLAELVRSGLIDAGAACDGELRVADDSRSNPVHVISVGEAPRLVVKQLGPSPEASTFGDAEAAAYRWLAGEPEIGTVAPRVAPVGGDHGWLVLEAPDQARTVHDLLPSLAAGDHAAIAAELGRLLGSLHLAGARGLQPSGLLDARWPWVFDLPAGRPPDFVAAHDGSQRMWAELGERSDLTALLEEVRGGWSPRAVIHGDVKWDNVLARREPGARWRLWLIDWELAGWGDPSWDVAAVAETIVTTSVLGRGGFDAAPAGRLCGIAASTYSAVAGPDLTANDEQLSRLLAARLVQVVVQLAAMAGHGEVSPATATLLELAGAIAADPPGWSAKLFAARG